MSHFPLGGFQDAGSTPVILTALLSQQAHLGFPTSSGRSGKRIKGDRGRQCLRSKLKTLMGQQEAEAGKDLLSPFCLWERLVVIICAGLLRKGTKVDLTTGQCLRIDLRGPAAGVERKVVCEPLASESPHASKRRPILTLDLVR